MGEMKGKVRGAKSEARNLTTNYADKHGLKCPVRLVPRAKCRYGHRSAMSLAA